MGDSWRLIHFWFSRLWISVTSAAGKCWFLVVVFLSLILISAISPFVVFCVVGGQHWAGKWARWLPSTVTFRARMTSTFYELLILQIRPGKLARSFPGWLPFGARKRFLPGSDWGQQKATRTTKQSRISLACVVGGRLNDFACFVHWATLFIFS